MYRTIEEVIEATLERYEGVGDLSITQPHIGPVRCLYGHEVNGIGCAIGCHVPAEVAEAMDRAGVLLEELRPVFLADVFADTVDSRDLYWLQKQHDGSKSVEEFRRRLRTRLETEEALAGLAGMVEWVVGAETAETETEKEAVYATVE